MVAVIKHLTVAIDGSPASEAAVRFACELARSGAMLSFCSVIAGAPVSEAAPEPVAGRPDTDGRELCEAAVRLAQSKGIAADRFERHGRTAETIAACARENGSDLIVIGTHARKGGPRGLGAVTDGLMHIADRPVIVVHENDTPGDGPIGVAFSGFDTSDHVLEPAIALALALGRELFFMTDVTIPEYEAIAPHPNAGDRVAAAAERARAAGVGSSYTIGDGIGTVAGTLIDAAERRGCSLIVTGLHNHSGLVRLFFGSVAEQLVRETRVPVTVVHHART